MKVVRKISEVAKDRATNPIKTWLISVLDIRKIDVWGVISSVKGTCTVCYGSRDEMENS